MRTLIKNLLEKSECVLSTGHSFLFVTDFEKKKYVELSEESEEPDLELTRVLLTPEWEEILELIKAGEVLFAHEDAFYDNGERIKMMSAVLKKKNLQNKENSDASDIVELYSSLSREKKQVIKELLIQLNK